MVPSVFDYLLERPGFWSVGRSSDVVISTRARLARNMPSIPFPGSMSEHETGLLRSVAHRFFEQSTLANLSYIELQGLDTVDRRFLRERNIITYEMEAGDSSFVIFDNDERFEIFVNEEDHFRVQAMRPGLQAHECYEEANRVEDELNRFVSFAFSEELGFLTASPANLGTGLRASSMVHLPSLTALKRMTDVTAAIAERGFLIRSTLGDEQKSVGGMYVVCNRASLGVSEVDIVEALDTVVAMIVEEENRARDDWCANYRQQLEDRVWRSYGLLRYSRSIGFLEAIANLANIRLGTILSIVKDIDLGAIHELMVRIQYAHLQKHFGAAFTGEGECDAFRAQYIRDQFN